MVGESLRTQRPEIVTELNRRIAKIKFNPDLDYYGSKDIEVIDIYVSILGKVPADLMMHFELFIRGYEHTVFTEDLPFSNLSTKKTCKSYTFSEVRIEVQKQIDIFLHEMCDQTTRGSNGRAIISSSFCA